jgi:hypothetical protein
MILTLNTVSLTALNFLAFIMKMEFVRNCIYTRQCRLILVVNGLMEA